MMNDREQEKQDEKSEMMIPVTGPDDGIEKESEKKSRPVSDEKANGSDADQTRYVEQLQRLQAEFDNYRRRVDRERETMYAMAKADLIQKILPVVDDLERMLNHHQEGEHRTEGVRLIYKNLTKILTEEGLEEVPSLGMPFNPDVHEAVGVEETDEEQDGMVVEEWQKGYRFGNRLLRPSRVKVGKHTGQAGDG
jgi:molecular chaperone GrpE